MTSVLVYIASVLVADLTANIFIPLPLFGVVGLGTFFFGLTFTQRDIVHRRYGHIRVYGMIVVTILLSVLLSLFLDVPYRILVASAVGMALSESLDTEVYQALKKRSWFFRAMASNAVSVPVDTVLFTLLAFYGMPGFSTYILLSIICGGIAVKFLIATCVAAIRSRLVVT